jgi:hypothetical protein
MIKDQRSGESSCAGLIWVSSVLDAMAHVVTDQDMAAGILAGSGEYAARCGETIIADACTAPAGPSCPTCTAIWRRRHVRPACISTTAHRHAKHGASWWARLVHGRSTRADR